MALLELKDIGKIYVSSQNVAVGIRGVNLSFEKGEFVAITGKSGSGKSTLLNVISGMDTYEEGDLLIEGNSTSHYIQSDWEEYREKYISFIFQDYNIIENFTVLQNVELALMNTYDPIERRKKALELLDRVGLSKAIHQKGSKLSGGQKQRTVIARALAKDSPIILADEPTGNLDSETSKEIIDLLHEVSKNKLVIIVTHNFEQVEMYATRHIRVYDGAIESDHEVSSYDCSNEEVRQPKKDSIGREILNGITLGRVMFKSKPKLTVFLCILLLVGVFSFFITLVASNGASDLLYEQKMFNEVEGRIVIVNENSTALTEEELNKIKNDTGALKVVHYDALFDTDIQLFDVNFHSTIDETFGNNIEGRYPKAIDEIFLYAPVYLNAQYDSLVGLSVGINNIYYKVVGVKYFYDNTKQAKIKFTDDGFAVLSYWSFLNTKTATRVTIGSGASAEQYIANLYPSLSIAKDKMFVRGDSYLGITGTENIKVDVNMSYISHETSEDVKKNINLSFGNEYIDNTFAYEGEEFIGYQSVDVYISLDLLLESMQQAMTETYRQASIIYKSNYKAKKAATAISGEKYLAVPANSTTANESLDVIVQTILGILSVFSLFIRVIFLAFFINICTNKSILSLKPDFSIMRSMGIKVKTIKAAMYVRMFLSLIPGYVALAIVATTIYLIPFTNGFVPYLHFGGYLFVFLMTSLIALLVARRQIKKLFSESVKTSLRGGTEQ